MSVLSEIEEGIQSLMTVPVYGMEPEQKHSALLPLFKKEVAFACERNKRFRNYVKHWPVDPMSAHRIADLPYLPASIFKSDPPLTLVGEAEIKHTLTSSGTSGQVPSRVVLDGATARRMAKGIVTIIREFIGTARRPYLIVDLPQTLAAGPWLGARQAAIQALAPFATNAACCLQPDREGNASLNLQCLLEFAAKWGDAAVLVYGFTSVIWDCLVKPLEAAGITMSLPKAHVLHSGGWKRLEQQAVTKDEFASAVASVLGCPADRVIDYYGMVENVGVVYPDCAYGYKHAPSFAEVIVRNPVTLAPVECGQQGLVQVCSVLPTSFPGFLVLTEDIAEIVGYDKCPCGRRGVVFRYARRAPKAELRGCGNLESEAFRPGSKSATHE